MTLQLLVLHCITAHKQEYYVYVYQYNQHTDVTINLVDAEQAESHDVSTPGSTTITIAGT